MANPTVEQKKDLWRTIARRGRRKKKGDWKLQNKWGGDVGDLGGRTGTTNLISLEEKKNSTMRLLIGDVVVTREIQDKN